MPDMSALLEEPFLEPLFRHWPALLMAAFLLIAIPVLRRYVTNNVRDSESRYRVRRYVTYGGFLLFLIFILIAISDQAARLSVILGALGAAGIFAMQEVIASIAGWVALSSGNFYDPGDRVQVGGIKGDVIDIGLLRTTLMETGAWVDGDLYSGRVVRVANSFVFKEPVFNYTTDFPFLWDEIKLPIRYGSDLKLAKKIMLDAAHDAVGQFTLESKQSWEELAEHFLIEKAGLEPTVTVRGNDNWIDCTLRYIVNYKARRSTADEITEAVLEGIAAAHGHVLIASTRYEELADRSVA